MPSNRLCPDGLPQRLADIIVKASTTWLANDEILALLTSVENAGLPVSTEAPMRPPGGSLFLFDKKACRYFRKDGHPWETKPDGKTVNETHEKLKGKRQQPVENVKTLNCYYARSGVDDLKRRSYWRLEVPAGEATYALVHYLHAEGKAGTGPVRYGGGALALSDDSEEDEDEGARRRRRGRAAASARGPPVCGAPDPAVDLQIPPELSRLHQFVNVQITAGGPAMVAPTSGMGSSLPFGGSGGLSAIAVSQLPSLPGFAPGLSLMPGLSSMLDPMLLSQLSLMQSQVEAGGSGGGGGDGPVVALPGTPDAAGLPPMWTSSLPPGYDIATAATLGSLQQQLAGAPGGVDALMHQATLEAAARSAALQRPQPGTLFSSGQLVAQQMAAAQQAQLVAMQHAQQQAQLAAVQQAQLAAQQQAAAAQAVATQQQHAQLAVAQAQLAALTEQKALAAQVVAQLQQVAEESSGLLAASGSGGLAAAPSGGSTAAGTALQPSGSAALSAAGSQQGAAAQQPQQPSAAEVNEQYAVAQVPPPASSSRPDAGPAPPPPGGAAGGGGSPPTAASARARLLRSQASFNDECMQRVLFHQMSLGLREGPEFAAQLAAVLGPPSSPEPGLEGGQGGAALPAPAGSSLAALLASPPRLRRGLSRNSSGIPRFTSFDARDDLGGLLASQLDTDINSLPEGPAADLDQPRSADPGPLFPGQRLQAQAVATVASAAAAAAASAGAPVGDSAGLSPAVTATEQHTLEPSPLLSPPGSTGATLSTGPSRSLTFALPSPSGSGSGSLVAASSGAVHSGGPDAAPASQQQQEALFSACVGVQAVRAPHGAGAGHPPRVLPGQQAPEALRRAAQEERAGAAAAAGAGARDERLAAARRDRSSTQEEPGSGGGSSDGAMLVDNPLLARLASFVRTGPGSGSTAAAAACKREEESTRSLLKNMSIEEVEAVHTIGVSTAGRLSPTQ